MGTRTSSRQAAQKAKEAICATSKNPEEATTGLKRKAEGEKASESRKEKKEDHAPQTKQDGTGVPGGPSTVPGTPSGVEKQPEPKHAVVEKEADGVPQTEPKEEPKPEKVPGTQCAVKKPAQQATSDEQGADRVPQTEPKEEPKPEKVPGAACPVDKPGKQATSVESGVRKSEEREEIVSSNILEKGLIYFFFRPRVNIEDPHGVNDVSRSFFVLRPTPLGAELDESQGLVDKDARCRLMMLPKKKFPTSGKERDMGFVEKSGQTMQDLQANFVAGRSYETSTRGERHVEEARPYAEGVYAITSTRRASHLAYVLTIPSELGEIQESFGLQERGSWIVQSKNPAHAGPSYAQLPKEPEYPEA